MAKAVSEEEIQLRKRARRRLVGAITLVIAAVVILPMVLDSKPEQRSHEIDIRIPSEDSAGELPAEAAPFAKAPVPAAPGKPATGMDEQPPSESGSSVKPAQSGNGSVEKLPANAAADAANLFVVQLGAFSNAAKARQQLQSVVSKDTKKDIRAKAYTETVKVDKGEITRVRVGPFDTREEAEGIREKLKKLGFDGVVTEK